jgi:CheY-like chemotaxis protein
MSEKPGILQVRLESIRLDQHSVEQYEGVNPGDYVQITVRDEGEGIAPEIIDNVVDPYFTTKDVDQGLGMGLAIVYGIVKKNDGAIKIESEIGKGTTVKVLFPQIEAQAEFEVPTSAETLPKGSERILLVDDEASLMKMVKQILERLGYQVVGKTDSVEALKIFQSEPNQFDLVITDMAMPQMAGDQLAQELIKIRSDVPIILCTGHSDRIDEERAGELGIAAYYMKPFDKRELAKTVRNVLVGTKK